MNQFGKKSHSRLLALDIAKTLAILAVVGVHLLWTPLRPYLVGWVGYMPVMLFLIVNGFTLAMSLDKKKVDTLGQYVTRFLPRHLWGILSTYLIAFGVEVYYHSVLVTRLQPAWLWLENNDPDDAFRYYFRFREILPMVFQGGLGPGAYYIPLLVMIALAFPLIYYPAKKYPVLTLAVCYWLYSLPTGQQLHTFLTRMDYMIPGIILYDRWRVAKGRPGWRWAVISLGVFAVGLLGTLGIQPIQEAHPILLTGFLGLLLWLCQKLPPKNILAALPCRLISLIGGASFHIFLAQKIYASSRLPAYLVFFHEFDDYKQVLMAILLGLVFWFVDRKLLRGAFTLVRRELAALKNRK